jgi:hypothetical protein
MSNAHTPGPWAVGERHPTNACAYVRDDKGHEVATLYFCSVGGAIGDDGIWPEQPNRDANARLIAAAPTMLAALRGLLEDAKSYGMADSAFSGSLIEAAAAIAKAEGRT